MMGHHKGLHTVAFGLLVVGGLNWLLAVWHKDVATWGLDTSVVNVVYVLIGLAALYEIFTHKNRCKECEMGMNK